VPDTYFDFFLRRAVKCGISASLVTLPITVVGSFALLGSLLGGKDDPHGVGGFIIVVFSFILGVSLSLAMGIVLGVVLNRRLR
jgi:hypothetical protein